MFVSTFDDLIMVYNSVLLNSNSSALDLFTLHYLSPKKAPFFKYSTVGSLVANEESGKGRVQSITG